MIKNYTKYIHFTAYLCFIVGIICLLNQKPVTPQLDYFCDAENIEDKLPDYPIREIKKEIWNYGVNITTGGGNIVSMDKTIVIEPYDSLCIYGWAIDNDRNCPISEIYMKINDKYIKGIYGLPRPDIKHGLKINGSSNVGFMFHFDRNLLIDKNGEFCTKSNFYMIDKESEMIISNVEYNLIHKCKRPNLTGREIVNTAWNKGLIIDRIIGGTLNNETKTIKIDNDNIQIIGWCVDIDNNKAFKHIYIAIGDYFYKPINFSSERPDVRAVFNLEESARVGFDFIIPQEILLDEKGYLFEYIEFYMEDQNGEICLPFKYYLQ